MSKTAIRKSILRVLGHNQLQSICAEYGTKRPYDLDRSACVSILLKAWPHGLILDRLHFIVSKAE